MIALDTNVLVRIVTRDDPEQLKAALEIFQSGPVWVAKTVLLELEWVLRYSYECDRRTIHDILGRLLGFRQLVLESRDAVIQARDWYEEGMDFADALHLASSHAAGSFATFDRRFAKAADRLFGDGRVRLLEGRGE